MLLLAGASCCMPELYPAVSACVGISHSGPASTRPTRLIGGSTQSSVCCPVVRRGHLSPSLFCSLDHTLIRLAACRRVNLVSIVTADKPACPSLPAGCAQAKSKPPSKLLSPPPPKNSGKTIMSILVANNLTTLIAAANVLNTTVLLTFNDPNSKGTLFAPTNEVSKVACVQSRYEAAAHSLHPTLCCRPLLRHSRRWGRPRHRCSPTLLHCWLCSSTTQ